MKRPLSGRSSTASATAGSVKLGHPVPDSNFASEPNRAAPQPAQRYSPVCLVEQVVPRHRRLGPGAAQNLVLGGRELLAPLLLGLCSLDLPLGVYS